MGTITILASHSYLLSVEPKKRGDTYVSGSSIGPHDSTGCTQCLEEDYQMENPVKIILSMNKNTIKT